MPAPRPAAARPSPSDGSRVTCRTPTPGRQPVRIASWKYRAVRDALLGLLPTRGEGVPFRELPALVAGALAPEERSRLGSASWYTTTVKLDLEVRGRIRRLPGSPQRLLKVA